LSENSWKEAVTDLRNPEKELEAIVRITDHFYKLEKWSEARFSALKWKKILSDGVNSGKLNKDKISSSLNFATNDQVLTDLQSIFPEHDPLTEVIF
jgi:hypothetical protein